MRRRYITSVTFPEALFTDLSKTFCFFYRNSYFLLRFTLWRAHASAEIIPFMLIKRKHRSNINGIYSSWLEILFRIRQLLPKKFIYDIVMSEKFSNILSKVIVKN